MIASVATATRYDSVACDERNFSSSEERALALLSFSFPEECVLALKGLSPQSSMLRRPTREFFVGQDKISSWERKNQP